MSTLWVFGYGSLIWNPGFDYKECKVGRIDGYCRRFYQGSDTHRGSPQRLGRVVTLMEEEGVSTWGRAFQFTDETSTLAYLTDREQSIGGYTTIITQFYPRDPKEEPFPVLVYIALPCNPLFLGSAPLEQIAIDITLSKGICGPNVEYLAKLAAFMKIQIPHEFDEHLYRLEDLVQKMLDTSEQKSLLNIFVDAVNSEFNDQTIGKSVENSWQSMDHLSQSTSAAVSSMNSSESLLLSEQPSLYTDRVSARKLRCINK